MAKCRVSIRSPVGADNYMYGSSTSNYLQWDASENNLIFKGAAGMSFGTLSSESQTGITLSSTNNSVFDVFADDGNATLGNAVYTTVRGRTMLFKDATGISLFSVRGQIKAANGVDFGPGVYAGVQGYMELVGDTSVQSGAKWWGVDSSFDVPSSKTLTVDSGGIAAGFHAELTGSGTATQSSGGILAGLYIDEQISNGAWGYGVYMSGVTQPIYASASLSSQGNTENKGIELAVTTDSTYLSGSNMTWSSAYGSSALKITGTYSGTGGYSNIYSLVNTSGAQSADGHGVVGIKGVVTNTAALTDGEVYGAQFIAKHNHASNTMDKIASLVGMEAWAYISDTGWAGTVIGANLGIHNECAGTYPSGSVHRAVQVFCDNNASANKPTESTGICIWNQAGSWDNVFKVVNSANGYTYFVDFTDDGAPAQDSSSAVNNVGTKGWIKVLVGSSTRYIPLGDGVS